MAYFDDETVGPLRGQKRRQPQGAPGRAQQPSAPAAYSTTPTQAPQTQVPSPDFGGSSLQRDPTQTPPIYQAPTPAPQQAPAPAFGGQPEPFRFKDIEPPTQDFTPERPERPNFPRSEPVPAPAPTDGTTEQTPAPEQPPAQPGAPLTSNDRDRFLELARAYPHTTEGLDQLIRDHPELGIVRDGKGDIRLADGTYIDVILAAGAGGQGWQWLNDGQGGQSAQSGQGALSQPMGLPPTLGSLTSNLSAAGLTAFQEQMRRMILEQLAGASQPVDPNSPEVRLPVNEAERRAEQIRRRRQSADAERLTQRGLGDSGALDTARRQGFEDMSQTISGVTAQIISEQMQNKRRELVTLLTTAMASGDAESARQVQMQLAAIDAELRRMGLAQQNDQYYSGLGQQRDQFNSSMDLDWARHQSGLL